jgi:Xaa-Pro aminopeptidase
MTPLNQFLPVGLDRSRLTSVMQERGLAGLLLTSPENVFYTTGYTSLPSAGNPILYMLRNRLPFFSFVDREGRVTLLCWAFSTVGMEFGADEVVGFNNLAEGVAAVRSTVAAAAAGGGTIGIESSCPYYILDCIGALPDGAARTKLLVADNLLDNLRLIKTEAEVAMLQKSINIIEATCGELFEILRLGMRRNELTREAKTRLHRNGADGISHLTFSFGQANPEFDIDEPLDPNRLVTIDLGGIYRGYCSDNRRYAYSGAVPVSLRDTYESMVAIVDGVGAALVPGTSYKDLMHLARDLYRHHGVSPLPRFNHVGHNIGLETEERWIDDDPDARVQAGMVINIELYTNHPSGGQIGDEETYVVGPSGSTRVSRLPREIREIR